MSRALRIEDDVRKVLEGGVVTEGQSLKITAQLDRALYVKVNKVLEALGGAWKRNLKAHLFADDAGSAVEQALIAGEVTTAQSVGFFPTPEALAERMADFVVQGGCRLVLEPSAGTGVLVSAVLKRGVPVCAVEWDPQRRAALAALPKVAVLDEPDFLAAPFKGAFDGIISNPPFCKVGKGDHLDHLTRMVSLLKSGGRLACVMPRSIEFRMDKRHVALRQLIALRGGRIEALPDGTFKASGTMVNTSLVLLEGA
jgi:phospholipid N-methyltransferase